MDWQPIETAPKDGTSVLLACSDGIHKQVNQAEWDVDEWICTGGKRDSGNFLGAYEPYAWQPLPSPPKE